VSRTAALVAALVAGLVVAHRAPPAVAQVVLPPGMGMPAGQTVPSPAFDMAFAALAAGDASGALDIATREYKGGMRVGAKRWIDSIAAAAAVGECHYELGGLREAVGAYDEALLLYATHADWLLAVQFPPQRLRPQGGPRVATWGRSGRNVQAASLPGTVSIRQGGADPQRVLQQGGVLAGTVDLPVRPHEIMRSVVIALYRRGAILGELGREGAAIDEAVKALSRRPAPPNHYSQSWIDVALGTALWSQGKLEQAQPLLNRGLLVESEFDHPLAAWALIVLGRIALATDQMPTAIRCFEEATYTAADAGDARALEEAFRLAAAAHLAAGTRGVPPTIRAGAEWARTNLPLLFASLRGLEAEALAVAGDARAANAAIADVDGRLLRGDPGRGRVGAQHAYAQALASYATGDVAAGDRELEKALGIARRRSPRLFQSARLVESLLSGSNAFSDRQADALFATLLGDPSPRDVAIDPLDALAAGTTSRTEAFDAWATVAARRGSDALLDANEAALRSRWLVAQPLGGRRAALVRLIGADPDLLPRDDAARRAALLARHPDLAGLLERVAQVRTPLTAALHAAAGRPADAEGGAAAPPGDRAAWQDYRQLAGRCGQFVAALAAGRDAPPVDMPPLTRSPEIRRRLAPRQLVLSFRWTAGGITGALESKDRVATWQVRQSAAVAKEIAALARGMCLFDAAAPIPTERLAAGEWRASAERLERLLLENSRVSLGEGIDELVIVPDGLLWYVPFELLPVATGRGVAVAPAVKGAADDEGRRPLGDVCRIRYCPTRSLAVLRFAPPRGSGAIGVYTGRLFRGEKPGVAEEIGARLVESLERVVPLSPPDPGTPVPLVASLLDTLVVFDELAGDGPVATRPLLVPHTGRPGMTFGDWLAAPAKRPTCVVLPGLQTAVAGGLSKPPTRPGEDLFMAVTDLVVAGARTAVVSRWRMGGKVGVDLVEEFLRDRCVSGDEDRPPPASESWQRAVGIVSVEEPDVEREPRLKASAGTALTDARHPLFWAGYVLVDCGGGEYTDEPAPAAAKPPAAPGQPGPPAQPAGGIPQPAGGIPQPAGGIPQPPAAPPAMPPAVKPPRGNPAPVNPANPAAPGRPGPQQRPLNPAAPPK